MTKIQNDRVTLEETVPFQWTRVYSFGPYFPLKDIERITRSKSPALDDSISEGMVSLIFMNHRIFRGDPLRMNRGKNLRMRE